MFDEYSMN